MTYAHRSFGPAAERSAGPEVGAGQPRSKLGCAVLDFQVMEGCSGDDDPLPSPSLAPAWEHVLRDWNDEVAHRKFLALCSATDRLAEAGRCYRTVRDNDPERAEMASRQIDELLSLAMQNLAVLKTKPRRRTRKTLMFLFALGVSLALVVTALGTLLRFS